jgi:hypothetical protein
MMSQHDRSLEQQPLRHDPDTREKEVILRRVQGQQTNAQTLLEEDVQLLRETFAIIAPQAVRIDIHTYLDASDGSIVVEGVDVYDELGHLIPCQGQDADNWTELLSAEYLGFILHCMYEEAAVGVHQFPLK